MGFIRQIGKYKSIWIVSRINAQSRAHWQTKTKSRFFILFIFYFVFFFLSFNVCSMKNDKKGNRNETYNETWLELRRRWKISECKYKRTINVNHFPCPSLHIWYIWYIVLCERLSFKHFIINDLFEKIKRIIGKTVTDTKNSHKKR